MVSVLGGESFWAELEKLQKVSKSNQVQQGLQNCLGELALKSFLPFSFQNLKRFKIKIWDLRFKMFDLEWFNTCAVDKPSNISQKPVQELYELKPGCQFSLQMTV